jgi:transposase-like protein
MRWYLRCLLSLRAVEESLVERGLAVEYARSLNNILEQDHRAIKRRVKAT